MLSEDHNIKIFLNGFQIFLTYTIMDTAGKMNALLILSYWICNSILLVEGKKYSCVLKNNKVPPAEFGPDHYGELGFLRNVIIDVAGFLHTAMNLETPLRLCKMLSDTKTSYWKYFRYGWKKKTRDKYEADFKSLKEKAERVLDDLIKDARLTPEFPQEDQDGLAKIIDEAKDRLLASKTLTDAVGPILNYLNGLRSTYCPKAPAPSPNNNKSSGSQSDPTVVNRYAKPPLSIPMKSMSVDPSTTQNVVAHLPATRNVPFEPLAAALPKRSLPQESENGFAPKTAVPSDPSAERGQTGVPKYTSDWHKTMPQPNQAIPTVDRTTLQPSTEEKCPSGKVHRPVWIDKDNNVIGPADMRPGMAASDPSPVSQNNHVHTPVKVNAVPGGTGNVPPSAAAPKKPQQDYFYLNPDVMRRYLSEDEVQKHIANQKAREDAAAADAAVPPTYSAPPTKAMKPQVSLPPGTVSSSDLQHRSVKLPGTQSLVPQNSGKGNYKPLTASDPIYELQEASEFPYKVLRADKPVFVQFHASYCDPCKQMTPVLQGIIEEKKGKVYLVRVNDEKFDSNTLCAECAVHGLPNIKVFQNGIKQEDETGYSGAGSLRTLINKYCS